MIFIRNRQIIIAALAAVMLSGCASHESAPPRTAITSQLCHITYNGRESEAVVTNIPNGATTVSFTSPDSLDGMVYTLTADGCRVSFGDLSYSTPSPQLDRRALPQLIRDLLVGISCSDLREENTAEGTVYSGELDGFRYTLECADRTGHINTISSKALALKVEFPDQSDSEAS